MREIGFMFENEPKKEQYIGAWERNLQEELMNAELLEERAMVRRELNELNKLKKNK